MSHHKTPAGARVRIAYLFAGIGYNGMVFRAARRAADKAGKQLLNAGCKKVYTNLSDVNLDIAKRNVPNFVRGDIQNLKMFDDKQFGAVYCSHVIEHVDDPDQAMKELDRVADNVFIITPPPWWPWTWFYPGHKWVFWGTRKICRIRRPDLSRLFNTQSGTETTNQ